MKLLEDYSNQELTKQNQHEVTGGKMHMYQDSDCTIFYEFSPNGEPQGSVWAWHA